MQLHMENASAVAHIATLEVCANQSLTSKPSTLLLYIVCCRSYALLKLVVYADGAERTQPQLFEHLSSAQAESCRQSASRGRDCQAQERLGTEFGALPLYLQAAC